MPAPRVFTPDMRAVNEVVSQALELPEGVTVFWRVEKYGSLEATSQLSKRFANAFTALRARTRRQAEEEETKGGYIKRDTTALGPLDRLVCQRLIMADDAGWSVAIFRDDILTSALEVMDNATGELITGVGVGETEEAKLLSKAIHQRKHFTTDDWDRLTSLDTQASGEPWYIVNGVLWFPRAQALGARIVPIPQRPADPAALTEADDAFDAAIDAFDAG